MPRKIVTLRDKYKSTTALYPRVVEECLPEDYQGLPTEITNKLDKGVYYTTTAPTFYMGDDYGIGFSYIGNKNNDIDFKLGDLVIYINNGTTESVFKVNEINTESNLLGLTKIGDIGGGKQLYKHNVWVHDNGYTTNLAITIINDSNEKINTYDKLKAYLLATTNTNLFCDVSGRVNAIEVVGLFITNAEVKYWSITGTSGDLSTIPELTWTDSVIAL